MTIAVAGFIWAGDLAESLLPRIIDSDGTQLVRAGMIALPVAVFTLLLLSLARGLGSTRPLILIDQVLKPLLRVLLAGLIFLLGWVSTAALTASWLLPVFVGFVLAVPTTVLVVRRSHRAISPDESSDGRSAMYRFAAPRSIAQLIDIVSASVGVLLLSTFGTAFETGLFATALRLALAGQLAYQAIRLLIAPILAHDLAIGDTRAAQSVYSSATVLIVTVAWPFYLILMSAPALVLSIFGAEFSEAASSLVLLSIGCAVLAVLGNMQAAVLMSGRSTWALLATGTGLLVNLLVTLTLLWSLGAKAAALGWTLGVIAESTLLAVAAVQLGLRPGSRPVVLSALRATVIVLPVCVVAGLVWTHVSVPGGIFIALLGILAYALVQRGTAVHAWREFTLQRKIEAEASG